MVLAATTFDGLVERALVGVRWLRFRDAREEPIGSGFERRLVATGARAGVRIETTTELVHLERFREEAPFDAVLLFFSSAPYTALGMQYAANEGIALFQLGEADGGLSPGNPMARSLVRQATASAATEARAETEGSGAPSTETTTSATSAAVAQASPQRDGLMLEEWFWTAVIVLLALGVLVAMATNWSPVKSTDSPRYGQVTTRFVSCSSVPAASVVDAHGTISNTSLKPIHIRLTAIATARWQQVATSSRAMMTTRVSSHETKAWHTQIEAPRSWAEPGATRTCVATVSAVAR